MTKNYNVSFYSALNYFYNEVNKHNLYDKLNIKEVNLFIKDFYNFLENDLFNILYLNNKDTVINSKYKINIDNDDIYLHYQKKGEKKYEIKVLNFRWVLSKTILDTEIDTKTSLNALPANIIHVCDAELARYLATNVECYIIHDSFSVDITSLHILMDKTNEYFNKKLNTNNYSIFILI